MTRVWVNNDRIIIFVWSITLTSRPFPPHQLKSTHNFFPDKIFYNLAFLETYTVLCKHLGHVSIFSENGFESIIYIFCFSMSVGVWQQLVLYTEIWSRHRRVCLLLHEEKIKLRRNKSRKFASQIRLKAKRNVWKCKWQIYISSWSTTSKLINNCFKIIFGVKIPTNCFVPTDFCFIEIVFCSFKKHRPNKKAIKQST